MVYKRQIITYASILLAILSSFYGMPWLIPFTTDYDAFLTEDFDANQYVNSAINDSDSSEAGDAATALAKLSFNVDSLEKQIKDQVNRRPARYHWPIILP
jgi:Golgi transport complex subunit 5